MAGRGLWTHICAFRIYSPVKKLTKLFAFRFHLPPQSQYPRVRKEGHVLASRMTVSQVKPFSRPIFCAIPVLSHPGALVTLLSCLQPTDALRLVPNFPEFSTTLTSSLANRPSFPWPFISTTFLQGICLVQVINQCKQGVYLPLWLFSGQMTCAFQEALNFVRIG